MLTMTECSVVAGRHARLKGQPQRMVQWFESRPVNNSADVQGSEFIVGSTRHSDNVPFISAHYEHIMDTP